MDTEFYDDTIDTEEIEDLVVEVLRTYKAPWSKDIIDKVFLTIEKDPNKLQRYKMFAGEDPAVTNQWIGKYVKEYTGLKVVGHSNEPKSSLIKSFSLLGYGGPFLQAIIVFDFDGVLADTLDEMLRIAGRVAAELGYACQPSPADLDALERMEFRELGRQLGIPGDLVDEFALRSFELFASLPSPPKIFPGMKAVVLELARANHLAIVTGNTSRIVERLLNEHGLAASFDMILGSDAPGVRAEKLKKIVSTLGEPDGKAYLVGDAVSDVRVAVETGITSIAVTWGHQSEAHLRQANPNFLAHTPQELLLLLNRAVDNGIQAD